MGLTTVMHMKVDLLDNIRNIRTGECKVLEGTSNTSVVSSIGNRRTVNNRELSTSLEWSKACNQSYMHGLESQACSGIVSRTYRQHCEL